MKMVREKQMWLEVMHEAQYKMGVTIGQKDKENTRLQEENEEKEKENTRLQEENDKLKAEAKAAAKTMLLDKQLEAMSCPLCMDLFKDPVVSKLGHSFERVYSV